MTTQKTWQDHVAERDDYNYIGHLSPVEHVLARRERENQRRRMRARIKARRKAAQKRSDARVFTGARSAPDVPCRSSLEGILSYVSLSDVREIVAPSLTHGGAP